MGLQADLDNVYHWVNDNNMELNGTKFEHLPIGKRRKFERFLTDTQELITKCQHVRDLGVYMSDKLDFQHHINNLVSKGINMCNWILRTFTTRSTFPMSILLKTLIYPVVEYASVVWSPNKKELIGLIETVQRKFTKQFDEFNTVDDQTGVRTCNANYWERLACLKLYSLERRRERYQIFFLYKILRGAYPNPGLDLPNIQVNPRGESK